uniref:ATP synthase F0 subunit 8 n=1 Tax=Euphyllura phillyreae TaxID=2008460 RepID=A0A344A2A8_9HEMI|nr:ATP synthase F0 subunit 8 [Euphyllura phillyreae]AWU48899.1 ATP synthase F0 subunit 8 [Euphyllura phillyreae]
MPQMSPMPWILLLIMSLIILMLVTSMIYFNLDMNLYSLKKKSTKLLNLKW